MGTTLYCSEFCICCSLLVINGGLWSNIPKLEVTDKQFSDFNFLPSCLKLPVGEYITPLRPSPCRQLIVVVVDKQQRKSFNSQTNAVSFSFRAYILILIVDIFEDLFTFFFTSMSFQRRNKIKEGQQLFNFLLYRQITGVF